jgi:hypothetical protein
MIILMTAATCKKQKISSAFKKYPKKNGIIEADKDILQKIKKKFKHSIVYFYSSKCVNCKKLNKMFPDIKKNNLPFMEANLVPIVRFNCDKFPEYCSINEKITHFPAIRVYYDQHHFVTYYGKLDAVDLTKWLTQRVFYSWFEIETANLPLEHMLKNNQLVVLKTNPMLVLSEEKYSMDYDSQKEDKLRQIQLESFKVLGFRTQHAHFYFSKDDSVVREKLQGHCLESMDEEENRNAMFVLINPDDRECYFFTEKMYSEKYDGKYSLNNSMVDKGHKFIKSHQKPLISEFSNFTIKLHHKMKQPIAIYFTEYGKPFSNFLNNFIRGNQPRPKLGRYQVLGPKLKRRSDLHLPSKILYHPALNHFIQKPGTIPRSDFLKLPHPKNRKNEQPSLLWKQIQDEQRSIKERPDSLIYQEPCREKTDIVQEVPRLHPDKGRK